MNRTGRFALGRAVQAMALSDAPALGARIKADLFRELGNLILRATSDKRPYVVIQLGFEERSNAYDEVTIRVGAIIALAHHADAVRGEFVFDPGLAGLAAGFSDGCAYVGAMKFVPSGFHTYVFERKV